MIKSAFRKTILIAVLIMVFLGSLATWKYLSGRAADGRLVLSGTIEADEIHIGSKVGGRIEQVLVREGQDVKLGESLIRFETYDLDARRRDAVAAVAQAEANYQKALNWFRPEEVAEARAQAEAAWMNYELARNGPRKQEIEAARAELDAAEADYRLSKASFARIEKLVSDGVASHQDYDNQKAAFDRASGMRDSARQKLDLLLAGTRPEEIERADRQFKQAAANRQMLERGGRKEDVDLARAQVDRARAALEQIETQLTELEVKAPADAYIEVLQVRPGELITPNSPVATLVEVDRLWVRVYVPETESGNIIVGQEVSVQVDAPRNITFAGKVESVASRGEFTPRNVQTREERTHQVFPIRVRLDNTARNLHPGMAADVTILRSDKSSR
jgi:membrane fusion protein YbhG